MPRIVVVDGSRSWVQEVPENTERISVGRALSNTVIIEDTSASREHCLVQLEEDSFWLVDLQSRNGTRLNGRFVDKALLRPGDRIEIGATIITLAPGRAGDGGTREAERLESEIKAQVLASPELLSTDHLTGLASFPAITQDLRRLLLDSNEPPPVALVKLDIDYLGLMNDMFGMRAGDEIIRHVGNMIRSVVDDLPGGSRITPGREAGGKFILLQPDSSAESAAELAELVRGRVAESQLEGALSEAAITLSAGVAQAPEHARSWEILLLRAEAALADAKRAGRDRVTIHAPHEGSPPVQGSPVRHETRTSGLWAASGVWSSNVAGVKGTGPQGVVSSLSLSHAGQSLLGLVVQALGSDLELDPLLELTLQILMEATRARRGYVLLRDSRGSLRLRKALDSTVPGVGADHASISQRIVREVVENRSLVHVDDALSDKRFKDSASVVAQGLRSVLASPILWGEEVVGVVYLDNKSVVEGFSKESRDLVLAFGRLIAGPIRGQLLHEARSTELERARVALSRTAESEGRRRFRYANIVGGSAAMRKLFKMLDRLADSIHPVLIYGESGTGKELVATAIHYNGARKDQPFIAENCAAFTDTLLESELFGHIRGSFTGASSDRIGLVEAADGGTLFLDEIGEMSERMQAKLLRVLQEGELRPVGGRDVRKVDIRLICASNRNLTEMVKDGAFREDLYYRIAVMTVEVPPLRERREDIPLLVDHFLSATAASEQRTPPQMQRETLQLLTHYDWPGNVRELENEVKKLLTLAPDKITSEHLSPKFLGGAAPNRAQSALRRVAIEDGSEAILLMIERGRTLAQSIEAFETEAIARVLQAANGNRSETARRMGLSRPGLLKKMKRYGIE